MDVSWHQDKSCSLNPWPPTKQEMIFFPALKSNTYNGERGSSSTNLEKVTSLKIQISILPVHLALICKVTPARAPWMLKPAQLILFAELLNSLKRVKTKSEGDASKFPICKFYLHSVSHCLYSTSLHRLPTPSPSLLCPFSSIIWSSAPRHCVFRLWH